MTDPWWKVVWSLIKDLPDFIADRIDHWLLYPHDPEDLGDPTPGCLRCKAPWPCDEFIRISDRRLARKRQHAAKQEEDTRR